MASPRDARIAGAVIAALTGGVVWNVAYQQDAPRERRRTSIPVGVNVPMPKSQTATAEPRRTSGPVTLSLAALIEQSEAARSAEVPAAEAPATAPAPEAPAAGRMSGIAQSLDRLASAGTPQTPPPAANPTTTLVRDVQAALTARGYGPIAADGGLGPMTRAAILAFEHDHGLVATAEPSDGLLAALRAPGRRVTSGARWQKPGEAATALVRSVQQQLIATGYLKGQATGVLDAATGAAIRAYETANQLAPTGRISAPLIARIQQSRARVAAGQ